MSLTTYQRIFGAGPRGTVISVAAFALAAGLGYWLKMPPIHGVALLGIAALVTGVALAAAIIVWSLRSLPPETRGRKLVTGGAFRYFRHPLYAAMIGPFSLGIAVFLDSWVYLVWFVLQYPIWHLNIGAEEKLMRQEFGEEYETYCRKTGRFLPKL